MADDNGEAERTGLDFGIELICNYEIPNEPLKTAFIKIPNFYYFDYHTKEYTEFIDLSFSEITSKFPYPIFTAELCDVNQNTIVSKGIKKIPLMKVELLQQLLRWNI